jgi:hypothetical protein
MHQRAQPRRHTTGRLLTSNSSIAAYRQPFAANREATALFIFVNQFKDGAQFKDNAFEPRHVWN